MQQFHMVHPNVNSASFHSHKCPGLGSMQLGHPTQMPGDEAEESLLQGSELGDKDSELGALMEGPGVRNVVQGMTRTYRFLYYWAGPQAIQVLASVFSSLIESDRTKWHLALPIRYMGEEF